MAERPVPLIALGLPYLAQLVVTVGAAAILQPPEDLGEALYDVRFGVVVLAGYVALVAAVLAIVRSAGGAPGTTLALRRTPPGRTAAQVTVVVLAAAAASVALEPVFHGVEEQGVDPGAFPGGAAAALALALTICGFVLVGPVAEELYFRGLLQGHLLRFGGAAALLVPAALFAVVHFQLAAIPVLAVYGLLLGALRARTASIVPCCIVHVLNNGAALGFALHSAG